MGAVVPLLPVVSVSFVGGSFLWLRSRVAAYNAAADDVVKATDRLRDVKVKQLGGADLSVEVGQAARDLEAATRTMDKARTVRLFGLVASNNDFLDM